MSVEVRTTFDPDTVVEVSEREADDLRVQGLLVELDGKAVELPKTDEVADPAPPKVPASKKKGGE